MLHFKPSNIFRPFCYLSKCVAGNRDMAKTREYRDSCFSQQSLGANNQTKTRAMKWFIKGFKWDPEHFPPHEQVKRQPKVTLKRLFYSPDLRFVIWAREGSFCLQDKFKQLLKRIINLFWLAKRFWIIMCFNLSLQSSGFKAIQMAMFNGCPNPSSRG